MAALFGAALRAARAATSTYELERSTGICHSFVSVLESGKRHPSRRTVARIVVALDLTGEDAARLWHAAGYLTPEEWAAVP